METMNAVITYAAIGLDGSDPLTVSVLLDYGTTEQVFGSVVYSLKKGVHARNYAGHFIYRMLEVAGVSKWEELKGKAVWVVADASLVEAVGHIIKDIWFCPREEFSGPEQDKTP
jgi:hypothetical protein